MRKKLFIASGGALFGLLILTIAVTMDTHWLKGLDGIFIQNRLPNIFYLTAFAGATAKLATIGPMIIIFSILAIFLLRVHQRTWVIWLFGNLLCVSGAGFVLKQLIQRARPDQLQYIARSSYSFPSGHSLLTATFICSVILLYSFSEKKMPALVKILLVLSLIIITGGRIYLGVHYSSDVLAGLFLGFGLTFGSAGLFYPYLKPKTIGLRRRRRASIFS